MLTLPPTVRIHLAVDPVDMRRSFDGLAAAVRETLRADPLSGHLFLFRNRRGDACKCLWWDRGGFVIVYKRLERGVFHLPRPATPGAVEVEVEAGELLLMREGIDLSGARRRARWEPRSIERRA
jgi:transposase